MFIRDMSNVTWNERTFLSFKARTGGFRGIRPLKVDVLINLLLRVKQVSTQWIRIWRKANFCVVIKIIQDTHGNYSGETDCVGYVSVSNAGWNSRRTRPENESDQTWHCERKHDNWFEETKPKVIRRNKYLSKLLVISLSLISIRRTDGFVIRTDCVDKWMRLT